MFESAYQYFKERGLEKNVLVFDQSSATVELAAQAAGVEPARIAKTLSFMTNEGAVLIVAAGDAKIDNPKYKAYFSQKAKMLTPDEVLEFTGHAVGGVCPFALKTPVRVFLDVSMQRFETVFPACGSDNSAVQLTCEQLFEHSGAVEWIDVCKGWQEQSE